MRKYPVSYTHLDLKCIYSKENIWGEIDNQKQYEYVKNNIVKSLYKKEKDL